jgi:F0F1-type ATP synthase membrane subunit c/vacuolar-type H+-ATPase subunit K
MDQGVRSTLPTVRLNLYNFIRNIANRVPTFMFYGIGRAMGLAIAAGLASTIGAAAGIAWKIAQQIANTFPHSPAKRGPLSGSGDPYLSGKRIVERLSKGMEAGKFSALLASKGAGMGAGIATPTLVTGMAQQPATVHQNLTVYTQEISPVRQSAELGFLLAGRSA